jgi:hypothetical protein
MTQRSKTTIFNAALTRTGNNSSTEGDGSILWEALETNYDEIVRCGFEDGEYPFGRIRSQLTSRADGGLGYEDAYTYPSEIIHITDVYLDDCRASDLQEAWDIDASTRQLMIDASGRKVEIEGLKLALAIQRKLEAVIKDVLEESEESSMKDSEGDFMMMKASVKGSKSRSKRKFRKGGRLVRAHLGYGGR